VAASRRLDQALEDLRGRQVRRRHRRRVGGHHGGGKPQSGMANIGGWIFAPLTSGLFFSRGRS